MIDKCRWKIRLSDDKTTAAHSFSERCALFHKHCGEGFMEKKAVTWERKKPYQAAQTLRHR
jgi:hypothetical protein